MGSRWFKYHQSPEDMGRSEPELGGLGKDMMMLLAFKLQPVLTERTVFHRKTF